MHNYRKISHKIEENVEVDFSCYICSKPHIAKICPDLITDVQNLKYKKKINMDIPSKIEKIKSMQDDYFKKIEEENFSLDPNERFFEFDYDDYCRDINDIERDIQEEQIEE
jgi:hypothetical protein